MTRSERRYRTERVIKRRLKKYFWLPSNGVILQEPHRLSKWNNTCDCAICKWAKVSDKTIVKFKLFRRNPNLTNMK